MRALKMAPLSHRTILLLNALLLTTVFVSNRLVSSQYRFHKEVDSGLLQLLVVSERETN